MPTFDDLVLRFRRKTFSRNYNFFLDILYDDYKRYHCGYTIYKGFIIYNKGAGMIDRLVLNTNETAELDTTNNSITVLVVSGSVNVTKEGTTIATLGQYEIYTLPINTGAYWIDSTTDNTIVYIFRTFVY